MKCIKKTTGEPLLPGWVIKLQAYGGDSSKHVLYKVIRVDDSGAFCVPFSPISKKVFDDRVQERKYYSGMYGTVRIAQTSEVEVFGTHRNNLDKGNGIKK